MYMIKCASIRFLLYFFSTLMGHYDQGEVKKRCLETWKVSFLILYSYMLMLAKALLLEFKKLSSKGKCFDINKILPTNFLRNCMEIILEKLYVDNGA